MIASVAGEKCFQRLHNISSNPSPTMATCRKASRISHSFFFSSLELSSLSPNARGDLDVSSSV